MQKLNRRKFVGLSTTLLSGVALTGSSLFGAPLLRKTRSRPNSKINGVQIGVITYSFRSMPDQSAEAILQYVLESGINAIELMGDTAENFAGKPENLVDVSTLRELQRTKRNGELTAAQQKEMEALEAQMSTYNGEVAKWRAKVPMDKFAELRDRYNTAGVSIYAFKPRAFGKDNTDAEIEWGMRVAKTLGASHVTLEHPNDDAHTLRLAKIAKKHDIFVAYHGHTQQTPTFWDTALAQSEHNAMNLDLGHYVAAGNAEPLAIIKNKHMRIKSMHLKDRKTPAGDMENVVWGNGDTPIGEALRLIRDQKYRFPVSIELEYKIPEGSDAVKEVAKCLAYCKKELT